MAEKRVGKVEHYYPKVKAAAVHLSGSVKVGDTVHIVGHGDDVTEKVTSLQLDHTPIEEGKPGQHIGLLVPERVHEGDEVLLVEGGKPRSAAMPAMPKSATPKPAAKRTKAKKATPKRRKAAKSRGVSKAKRAKPKRKPARKASRKTRAKRR